MQMNVRRSALALVLVGSVSLVASPAQAKLFKHMPSGQVVEPGKGRYGMVREVGVSAMAALGFGVALGLAKDVRDGKTTRYLVLSVRGMFGPGLGASAHLGHAVYTGGIAGDVLIPRREFAVNWGAAIGLGRERIDSDSHSMIERIPGTGISGSSERFLVGASAKMNFEVSRNFKLRLSSRGGV